MMIDTFPPRAEDWVPTSRLRWVERQGGFRNVHLAGEDAVVKVPDRMVLQQLWYCTPTPFTRKNEWRDVPLVEDAEL